MTRLPPLSLLLCIAVSSTALSAAPVTGRAVDAATGKPIAGAMVGVYQSGGGTVKTDRFGRFKLSADPGKRIIYYDGGNWLYRSTGRTYTTADVTSKGASNVKLSLWRIEFGRGKVFQPNGMPLPGAEVTVCGSEFAHAITDANGKFKVALPEDQRGPGG
jgi:hypothetical protein